ARRHLADAVAVEERDLLLEQVLERLLPKVHRDAFGRQIEIVIAHADRDVLGDQQREHEYGELIDALDVVALDAFVDRQSNGLRIRERREGANHNENEADAVRTALLAEQPHERTKMRTALRRR